MASYSVSVRCSFPKAGTLSLSLFYSCYGNRSPGFLDLTSGLSLTDPLVHKPLIWTECPTIGFPRSEALGLLDCAQEPRV